MASKSFEWRPAKLLQDYNIGQDFALLILNQPLKNGVNLRKLWKNSSVRVAADGGANRLHKLSSFHGKYSNLQLIIGDLDSLTPQVRDFYSSQPSPATVIHDADQESTDFAKAINWIRKEYPEGIDIVALGGIGGRVDQGLSQLHHLYLFQNDPDYATGRLFLLSGSSLTFLLKAGSHQIQVREEGEEDVFGKHVGIIPLKEAANITTKGFEWDVENWHSEIGGKLSTSNHILPESQVVSVTTDKGVLFTVALKEGDGDDE
ncbi:thiamine pyrophosphokinase, thiamine-binding domain [Fusarium oxysporum f. sp. vasinfectum]|uniref:Thiamine pyrophosphokinase n=1 Tax=Fusarium oxysporum f. sp. vasinfectum 25433 TaxID=1089449 RepID=X0LC68_FUSOX|nr:thiamine pyrophosphokinase [Fusarium oxysporum f. sp. vasinfectum 25433]KAK2681547.1 thiamine pyrophosphokinase, thiamine-binding domain [Fusarium oxysporum f. sp. vasinfectum]KAK2934021.1 thiamine pyrophosphokinase, thiamine-binding domain [Fusarium oxysporum f. sp. vasinfectum]